MVNFDAVFLLEGYFLQFKFIDKFDAVFLLKAYSLQFKADDNFDALIMLKVMPRSLKPMLTFTLYSC